ncbi:MAG: hypothetical protein UT63_C0073G0011 [Candidatus Gottesmanbacteria bacterium GW2011_GWC2_39_8]|uniref:DNA polymerase III subunit delta n=1 Tax=Candidatus Gottesmanbacteria bacterium GW2011_GWC2_39_8 TaxID=1618450 RepID=A0A0G0S9C4_9BACT|nr:MAG: hypothetical protein UT63_C0073G0011 [Candidatus Gottesmanbacteria bacterium GW2011_GWC2_39_8]
MVDIINLMITILHGENTVLSRQELNTIKTQSKDKETISLDGKSLDITKLTQALEARSLFVEEKLVIIENFLTRLGRKTKDDVLEYLSKSEIQPELVLWEGKEISKALLTKYFPKAKVRAFKPEASMFKFVESIGVVSVHDLLLLHHDLLKKEAAELVWFMIVRQFRYMILARDMGETGLAEFPPWQRGKYISQSKFFSLQQLILAYRKLLEIDLKIKRGLTPMPMDSLLDIFITSI